MTLGRALQPTPDEARDLLRGELFKPEYQQQNLLQRLSRWIDHLFDSSADAVSNVPAIAAAITVALLAALAIGLVVLAARTRRAAVTRRADRPLFVDETPTADALRSAALADLADGRYDDALLGAFRAGIRRQIEHGRIDDVAGATARELALAVEAAQPGVAGRVSAAAADFDRICYGGRTATRAQAETALALDLDLAPDHVRVRP